MKRKHIVILTISLMIVCGLILCIFLYNGIILFNGLWVLKYPVKGVDVSRYQGDIDWNVLAENDIQFAYIKATEGSGFTDIYFHKNYEDAQKTDLRIGAYHFFSFDSGAETQAENFISNVEKIENMLPPMVDVELYGDWVHNFPDKDEVAEELGLMLTILEEHYGIKPVIYSTEETYEVLLSDEFESYDIWIRNVFFIPKVPDGRSWTFWQYTNRARLKGYSGDEKYIDVNVFYGTQKQFDKYGR